MLFFFGIGFMLGFVVLWQSPCCCWRWSSELHEFRRLVLPWDSQNRGGKSLAKLWNPRSRAGRIWIHGI